MKRLQYVFSACFALVLLIQTTVVYAYLYPSSVVGTEFDYITDADPSTFLCMEYESFKVFEMPDKRFDGPLSQQAYVFTAYFTDGTNVQVVMDKDFGSKEVAEKDALRYTLRLGKLPTLYRDNIRHLIVHKGGVGTTAFAEDSGHFFTIYSDNATKRISTHDLEETFFHEGTHASIQVDHIETAAWQSAQAKDGTYVTDYAETNDKEDFAESALFAYTLIHHPERIPAAERAKIEAAIPNRLAYFKKVFSGPVTYSVGAAHVCDASAARPEDVPNEDNIVVPSSDLEVTHTVADEEPLSSTDTSGYESTVPTEVQVYANTSGVVFYGKQSVAEALWDVLVLEMGVNEGEVISFLGSWQGDTYDAAVQADMVQAAAKKFGLTESGIEQGFVNRYGGYYGEDGLIGTLANSNGASSGEETHSLFTKIKIRLIAIFNLLLGRE